MNLCHILENAAAFDPDRTAIHFRSTRLSHGDFAARIRRLAAGLEDAGVRAGDRIAVLATNHADTLTTLFAAARIGAILVPLNWRLAVPELREILADCTPRLLLAEASFADAAAAVAAAVAGLRLVHLDGAPIPGAVPFASLLSGREAAAAAVADGPVLIAYTSGTTGRPRGAVLSQRALAWNAVHAVHAQAMTRADHVLSVLPLFHVGGLNIQTTPALLLGATVTLHARFDAAATLAAIAAGRPTLTVLVPATLAALAAERGFAATDLSCLKAIATGSTQVPPDLVRPFTARGVPVLEVYGATETAPIAVHTALGAPATAGSAGRPALSVSVRVLDGDGEAVPDGTAGEIAVAGPNLFEGYWNDPEATGAAFSGGHFLTGDIGTRMPDGSLAVHDRKKNMLISGGENVYPAEVERALSAHPQVAACAVVGRPDPRWQEVPVAFVVAAPGTAPTAADLAAFLGSRIARFKQPREIHLVEALPVNALGKVQHFRLREMIAAGGAPGRRD